MTDTQVITFYTQNMTLQGNLSREIYRRFQATYKNPEINVFIFELFDKRVTLETKKRVSYEDSDQYNMNFWNPYRHTPSYLPKGPTMMIYLGDSFVCCNCNWKQDQHINHELKTIKWKSKAFLIVSIQVKMLYYLEDSVGRQYFSSNFPVSEDIDTTCRK